LAKRGRPPTPIDENVVVSLAERGWSIRQIAAAFKVDEKTIRKNYSALIEESRQHGAAKLLDVLWKRGVQEKSDKVLTHLADRILGKVATKIELTDETLDSLIEERLKSTARKEVE
jgi:hypothetical protein